MRPLPISPGDVYGRWTIVSLDRSGPRRKWLCRCVCGSESRVDSCDLKSGHSTSCGCYSRERRIETNTKHGHAKAGRKTPVYLVWEAMIKRCHTPSDKAFHDYGGRGIKVCDAWLADFEAFIRDMGIPTPGQSIERDDVNGNYEPSNCRWASRLEQNNNTRSNFMLATANGVVTIAEFARRHGLKYDVVQKQIWRYGATEIAGIKFEILGRRDSIQGRTA